MDTLFNMRVFLSAVRLGSFSAAARQMKTTPSVVAKRIGQLEAQFGVKLFRRSTRNIMLTAEGAGMVSRFVRLLADVDELEGEHKKERRSASRPRVRVAGAAGAMLLAPILCEFVQANPTLELDVEQSESLANPMESGCDIAVGFRSTSYQDVIDFPLAPYPLTVCASPAYVADHGRPRHPRDLVSHECMTSPAMGSTWRFASAEGEMTVEVHARLTGNNSILVREALARGMGIAMAPSFLVQDAIRSGELVRLLEDYTPAPLWLKALVPERRFEVPTVRTLLVFMRDRLRSRLEPTREIVRESRQAPA